MKKFRVWHKTEFGLGCETRRAKSKADCKAKLPKRILKGLMEIEEL